MPSYFTLKGFAQMLEIEVLSIPLFNVLPVPFNQIWD